VLNIFLNDTTHLAEPINSFSSETTIEYDMR
jgi:hypothetical protein